MKINNLILNRFYMLLFIIHFYENESFPTYSLNKLRGISTIYNYVLSDASQLYYVYILQLTTFFLTSIYPCLFLRLLTTLLCYLHYSCIASHGFFFIDQIHLLVATISFTFIGINSSKFLTNQVVHFVQGTICLSYFISGFGKLLNLLSSLSIKEIYYSAYHTPLNHMAHFYVDGTSLPAVVTPLFEHPALIVLCYLAVVLLEFFAFLPIFLKKLIPLYGVLLILFHILNAIPVGIIFGPTIAVLCYFFIYIPMLSRTS